MESEKEERVDRREKSGRVRMRAIGYGGAFALFAASLVLLSPIASAESTHASSVTLTKPYAGTTIGVGLFFTQGCGSTVSLLATPSFNLTTGVLTQGAGAATKSCGSALSVVDFTLGEEFESSHTFSTTTGKHTVSVFWNLKYKVSLAAKSGGKGQKAEAVAEVVTEAYLYNLTTGYTTVFAGSSASYVNTSSPTTHSYTVSISDTNATVPFVAADTYEVETDVATLVLAEVTAGKCTASASLNMGTSGEQATLTSIVIP